MEEFQTILNILNGTVNWGNEDGLRDGGWVSISYLDEQILFDENKKYYVEIKFNGIGGIYPFEKSAYSSANTSGMSFYRGDINQACTQFENGDWNIRIVLSGQNCGVIEDKEIWPGDMDGNLYVDEHDIIPLGIYYGSHGCYRMGDEYMWQAQQYPNGWDYIDAARADANGDGVVNISDLLVILVNWGKTGFETVAVGNIENTLDPSADDLEKYRENIDE